MKQKHPDDYLTLVNRGSSLYTTMCPLSLLGTPFGRRMVIIENEGQLMLQSPFIPQPEVLEKMNQLGEVTEIVVPTIFHDTFLQEVMEYFPSATYYTTNGAEKHLNKKVKQALISELADTPWNQVLTPIPLGGMPRVNECIFYHRASKTLLVSDLVFNIAGLEGRWIKILAHMLGFADSPTTSRLFKFMIKDKPEFLASLTNALKYDFDQILPSHFNTVPTNGKHVIEIIRASL